MNWRALDFDWNHVRAFVATAEEGSLSAAARVLGQTQPTLGRQVQALEARLGVTLFERAGRALRLTEAGRDLLVAATDLRENALRFSLAAEAQNQTVTGHVSITATDFVAASALPPVLAKLRARAPGLVIEIIASNDVRDLTRREADISIRHARPEQPDLIARLLYETQAFLYVSAGYLDRNGRPKTLADLAHADFVGFEDNTRFVELLGSFGVPVSRENIHVSAAGGAVIAELVRAGLGYAVLTADLAARVEGLERVLDDQFRVPIPTWLVTHRELHTSRRIRLVFDHLASELPRQPVRA